MRANMRIKKIIVCCLFFVCPLFFFGQMKVSDFYLSKTANGTENKLYFVDFWATWCGPCIHVSKYLKSLQMQYPDDFYIVSLTQENPEVVKKFMKKHRTGLAVAIDYEGEMFKKNNISSLPYGILYNALGKKLWEGHPADLKGFHVSNFLKKSTKRASVSKIFKHVSYSDKELLETEKEYIPSDDFEFVELSNRENAPLEIIYNDFFITLKGSLKDILTYSEKVYKDQIKMSTDLNKSYAMYFKYDTKAFKNMTNTILNGFKLNKTANKVKGDILVFNTDKPTFWDTRQIDWGENNEKYLIDDSELKADNVSIKEVTYILSKLLEMPIVLNGANFDKELHDWQIHYKYFDLMVSNFSDNFGVGVKKTNASYLEYTISKKR